VRGASRGNHGVRHRPAAFAAILLVTLAACSVDEPAITSTPLKFKCQASLSTEHTPFRQASGSIQTTSPGRDGAVLTKFAESTFHATFDRACPASAQGEWADATGDWVVTVLIGTRRDGTIAPELGTITVEHYGEEPPLFTDASNCPVTYTAFSPDEIAGHVECTSLLWSNDYKAQIDPDRATPIPDLEPFALLLTFEGRP
jgi:hypothetical protein